MGHGTIDGDPRDHCNGPNWAVASRATPAGAAAAAARRVRWAAALAGAGGRHSHNQTLRQCTSGMCGANGMMDPRRGIRITEGPLAEGRERGPPPQGSKRTPAIRFHTNKAERGKGLQKYMRMPSATTPRLPRVVGTCPKNSRGGRTRKCEKSGTVHCWAGFALGLLTIDSSITTSHVPSFDVT